MFVWCLVEIIKKREIIHSYNSKCNLGGRWDFSIVIIIYRAPDVRQKDLVANISIYSLSLHLSRFVCNLRGVENIPNIE